MILIIFDENNGIKQNQIYEVLSCVLYYLIYNYVYIQYLSCKSKTLISISSNIIFEQTSFNILIGIGIP